LLGLGLPFEFLREGFGLVRHSLANFLDCEFALGLSDFLVNAEFLANSELIDVLVLRQGSVII